MRQTTLHNNANNNQAIGQIARHFGSLLDLQALPQLADHQRLLAEVDQKPPLAQLQAIVEAKEAEYADKVAKSERLAHIATSLTSVVEAQSCDKLDTALQRLLGTQQPLENRFQKLYQERDEANAKVTEVSARLAELKEEAATLRKSKGSLELELQDARQAPVPSQSVLDELNAQLDSANAEARESRQAHDDLQVSMEEKEVEYEKDLKKTKQAWQQKLQTQRDDTVKALQKAETQHKEKMDKQRSEFDTKLIKATRATQSAEQKATDALQRVSKLETDRTQIDEDHRRNIRQLFEENEKLKKSLNDQASTNTKTVLKLNGKVDKLESDARIAAKETVRKALYEAANQRANDVEASMENAEGDHEKELKKPQDIARTAKQKLDNEVGERNKLKESTAAAVSSVQQLTRELSAARADLRTLDLKIDHTVAAGLRVRQEVCDQIEIKKTADPDLQACRAEVLELQGKRVSFARSLYDKLGVNPPALIVPDTHEGELLELLQQELQAAIDGFDLAETTQQRLYADIEEYFERICSDAQKIRHLERNLHQTREALAQKDPTRALEVI